MTRPRLGCSRTSLLPLYHCLATPSPLIPLRKFADSQLFHPFEREWRAWQAVDIRTSARSDALYREWSQKRLKGVEFAKVEEKSGGFEDCDSLKADSSLSSFLSTSFISTTLSASSLIASLPFSPLQHFSTSNKNGFSSFSTEHRTRINDLG